VITIAIFNVCFASEVLAKVATTAILRPILAKRLLLTFSIKPNRQRRSWSPEGAGR
jgi:hypothetical protein